MSRNHDPEQHDLNLLAAYAEGRLGSEERRRVEQHLTECFSCRATLSTWSRALPEPARRPMTALPVWLGAAAAVLLAAWLGTRVASTQPGSIDLRPSPASAPPVLPTQVGTGPSRDRPPAAAAPEQEPLQTKRGGEKRVGDKTFQLVAGEWVDGSFDPLAALPVVEASGASQRRSLLERQPALAPYARLGDHVTVVLGGTVYRFLPQAR